MEDRFIQQRRHAPGFSSSALDSTFEEEIGDEENISAEAERVRRKLDGDPFGVEVHDALRRGS